MMQVSIGDFLFKKGNEFMTKIPEVSFACHIEDESQYQISMCNDYIAPKGSIVKTQLLSANYSREESVYLTPKSVLFIYLWNEVNFKFKNHGSKFSETKWKFAEGLKFSNIRTYPNPFISENKYSTDKKIDSIGIDYSSLVSMPSVNLLYMLSWDVVGFEEIVSGIIRNFNSFLEIGEYINIDMLSDTNVYLRFQGCKNNSNFKNNQFEAAYLGISSWKGQLGAWFEFRCFGELQVENARDNANAINQKGSSYYTGKILFNVSTGNLLRADMTELITGLVTNRQGKLIPQQKRRFIQVMFLGYQKNKT